MVDLPNYLVGQVLHSILQGARVSVNMTRPDHSDLVMDFVYIVAVSINVLIVMDVMSGGKVSSVLWDKADKSLRRYHDWRAKEKQYEALRPWVLFEALNIVEGPNNADG